MFYNLIKSYFSFLLIKLTKKYAFRDGQSEENCFPSFTIEQIKFFDQFLRFSFKNKFSLDVIVEKITIENS